MFKKSPKPVKTRSILQSLEDFVANTAPSVPAPLMAGSVQEIDPVGVVGSAVGPLYHGLPAYGNGNLGQQAQAHQAHQWLPQQALNGALQARSPSNNSGLIPVVSVSGLQAKVREKVQTAIAQLPMKICARISDIHFYQEVPGGSMRFVVVFNNGHQIDFTDVDEFPAPEHIARIALECP